MRILLTIKLNLPANNYCFQFKFPTATFMLAISRACRHNSASFRLQSGIAMYSHYPAHYTFDSDSDAWQIGFHDFPEWQSACYKRETSSWKRRKACWPPLPPRWTKGCPCLLSPLQTDDLRIHLPALVALKIELHNAMLRKTPAKRSWHASWDSTAGKWSGCWISATPRRLRRWSRRCICWATKCA